MASRLSQQRTVGSIPKGMPPGIAGSTTVVKADEKRVAAAADSNGSDVSDQPVDKETALFDALFRILSCRREYERDRELANRVNADNYKGEDKSAMTDEEVVKRLSAVFNTTPVFGTRTQTALLVKWDGSAVWKEKTMKEPIDITQPEWEERTYRLKFQ